MGLFSFVKDAGAKIFGGGEEPAPAAAAADDDMKAKLRVLQEKRSEALKAEVAKMGLPTDGIEITMDGDVVKVTGSGVDQATREKIVTTLGNTLGVSAVDDQIEVNDGAAAATFYTVVSGDTLGKIAKEHYGNAGKYPVIFEANKPMLSNPDKIYPGQVLRIPPID